MAKRILIADDSVTIQKAFAMTFAGSGDVTLASARSADEGLTIAQKLHPDLIIADAVMPGRTGYELCASVRADPSLRSVPVYILSSPQQPYDEARGQKAGADGHLMKPWETTTMVEKIRELLQRGGSSAGAAHSSIPASVPAPPPPRAAAPMPISASSIDDEYGEISIDEAPRDTAPERRARVETPPPPAPALRRSSPSMPSVSSLGLTGAPAPAHTPAPPSAHPPGQSSLRPSLIPGLRPGAVPPARPGTTPSRPATNPGVPPAPPPPRPAAAPVGRTLMGLPAANVPIPGVVRPPTPPMPMQAPPPRPATGPQAPLAARSPTAPMTPVAPPVVSPSTIASSIDQKLASISAKGPEYEAIAKLSREVIEQVVWEVVPELAEAIIREHLEKRGRV